MSRISEQSHPSGLRHRLHEIIFEADTPACPGCGAYGHDSDAVYCKHCGTAL